MGRALYHVCAGEAVISGTSYRDAGVDIDAGDALVEAIKPLTRSTARPGADGEIGGFGGLFDLRAAGFRDPVLVASTDGVGTKLKVALAADIHDTVGIDLVAMCVNDIVVHGAEPLFFLDYFASGRLDTDRGRAIVAGITAGCREANCALIGGETAEMPGMYHGGDYDLAGFAVGAAERGRLLPIEPIVAGDVILGLASSGVHSNGFSLVRRVVETVGADYLSPSPFGAGKLGEALLAPTRIYVRSCLGAHRAGLVKGFAHITGGGFVENIPRVLPDEVVAEIDVRAWKMPSVFKWLARAGRVDAEEMVRTFNCGIGMIVVVSRDKARDATDQLSAAGEKVTTIGQIVDRTPQLPPVILNGLAEAWQD